jgi:5-methylcytosine-specific restriction endonuclease McrA
LKGKELSVFKKSLIITQGNRCYHCRKWLETFSNHLHHIKSKGAGGGDEHNNCVVLCVKCHRDAHDGKLKIKKC